MTVTTFSSPGQSSYPVPAGVTYITVDASGAAGSGARPGLGDRTVGKLIVAPGTEVVVVVGECNGSIVAAIGGGASGANPGGWSGGGASDVRVGGFDLGSRKIVAAGGGGTGGGVDGGHGGYGGGAFGGGGSAAKGNAGGAAGTQTVGDLGSGTPGKAGVSGGPGGGGGGGGYRGGAGGFGGVGAATTGAGGGGGGSGFLDHSVIDGAMYPGVRSGNGVVIITAVSVPPLAPTILSPASGGFIISPEANDITWRHNQVDLGGYQTKADLRYKISGGAWVEVLNCATTAPLYTLPAGTWPVSASVEFQVRTYGAAGAASPWSASSFTSTLSAIPAPLITSPAPGSDQFSTPVEMEWTHAGFTQDAVTMTRTSAPNGGTEYWSSGLVAGTAQNAMVPLDAIPGRLDWLNVRFRYFGHWSEVASVSIVSQYGPPAPPLLVLTQQTSPDGRGLPVVDVQVTNPSGSLGFADTLVTDLFRDGVRIATNLPNNSTFTDDGPTGGPVEYTALAFAASGGSASSY
jgi:hypothetical protein